MGYYYQREFYGASFFRQYIAFGYNVNLSFIGSGVDMNDKLILYDNAPENDDFVQTNKNTFNALAFIPTHHFMPAICSVRDSVLS